MIYITGDTHGKPARLATESIPFAQGWSKKDTLIICGDFGYLMNGTTREELFLRELSFRPYTICFLDGNRDNFTMLDSYRVTTWHGGLVHRIRHNVIHLMRGQIYKLEGRSIFTMGGGYSVDRYRRFENTDWWPQEMPSREEYEQAKANLAKNSMKVDYILSHAAPQSVMNQVYQCSADERELNEFLEWVKLNVDFKRWYFGHLHMDAAFDDRLYAMFLTVRDIATGAPIW